LRAENPDRLLLGALFCLVPVWSPHDVLQKTGTDEDITIRKAGDETYSIQLPFLKGLTLSEEDTISASILIAHVLCGGIFVKNLL
jgi:hypothetical protein